MSCHQAAARSAGTAGQRQGRPARAGSMRARVGSRQQALLGRAGTSRLLLGRCRYMAFSVAHCSGSVCRRCSCRAGLWQAQVGPQRHPPLFLGRPQHAQGSTEDLCGALHVKGCRLHLLAGQGCTWRAHVRAEAVQQAAGRARTPVRALSFSRMALAAGSWPQEGGRGPPRAQRSQLSRDRLGKLSAVRQRRFSAQQLPREDVHALQALLMVQTGHMTDQEPPRMPAQVALQCKAHTPSTPSGSR